MTMLLALFLLFIPFNHSLTYEDVFESPTQINQSFGWNNWAYARPYLDMARAPRGEPDAVVRAGGIPTVAYTDPNLCAGSYAVGGTPYAAPDCNGVPTSAFYNQDGAILTGSYDGKIQQRVGNPQSPTLQLAQRRAVALALGDGAYDALEIDDAGTPNEYYGGDLCWGLGTFSNGYSCVGAILASPPWGTYKLTNWRVGERVMAENLPIKVMWNGIQSTSATGAAEKEASIIHVIVTTRNAWGGMCELCFYTPGNKWTMTSPILDQRLQGIMDVINAGRNVIVVNGGVTDPLQREWGLAEVMLAYDPTHSYQEGSACGKANYIHACPEAALTFYDPYNPYPTSPAQLSNSGGLYIREFASCYNWGQAVGPCAAVVNPDPYNSHTYPTSLQNTYLHTVNIKGTSLCNCYSESGSVSEDGPQAPPVLPAASGYILFK